MVAHVVDVCVCVHLAVANAALVLELLHELAALSQRRLRLALPLLRRLQLGLQPRDVVVPLGHLLRAPHSTGSQHTRLTRS